MSHSTALRGRVADSSSSYAKQIIADLLQNKVDMSQLVITKALAKTGTSTSLATSYTMTHASRHRLLCKASTRRAGGAHETS